MLRKFLIDHGLSNRECEVAALVARGQTNKEVADQLFVTEKTIKFHLTNIYRKLNMKSRTQLIVWCLPHIHFAESQSLGVGQFVNPQNSIAQQNFTDRNSVNDLPDGRRNIANGDLRSIDRQTSINDSASMNSVTGTSAPAETPINEDLGLPMGQVNNLPKNFDPSSDIGSGNGSMSA